MKTTIGIGIQQQTRDACVERDCLSMVCLHTFFFKPFSPKPKRSLPNTQTTQAHNNASLVQHYDKKNPKNEETETSVRHKRNKLKQEQTHQCVKRHQNRQCVKENTHRTVTTTKS